jgi:uncharacterized protein YegL
MGQNILNTLEDQELILNKDEGALWESSLKELVESILPPDIIYSISIESIVTDEIIADNITNLDPNSETNYWGQATVQDIYTISYTIIKTEDIPLDIVMVMDRSGSMNDIIQGDPYNKIYYAKQAACNFVDGINITIDKVALVSFARYSQTDISLTHDHSLVKQKINDLVAGGTTDIGAGINDAIQEYGRTNASWVIILLSDGKTNTYQGYNDPIASREFALNQSEQAHELGIMIYTVGLGDKDDIDEELLKEIMTERYFYAPSASQLEEIYQTIAQDLIYEVKYDILKIEITLRGNIN